MPPINQINRPVAVFSGGSLHLLQSKRSVLLTALCAVRSRCVRRHMCCADAPCALARAGQCESWCLPFVVPGTPPQGLDLRTAHFQPHTYRSHRHESRIIEDFSCLRVVLQTLRASPRAARVGQHIRVSRKMHSKKQNSTQTFADISPKRANGVQSIVCNVSDVVRSLK